MGSAAAVAAVCALALAACAEPMVGTEEQASTVCADGPGILGMDVSSYETSIDWNAVHAAGVQYAFVRVSDGTQFPDPKFAEYWAGARAAGVIRGVYQYFRPSEDPIAQADLLLDQMGPLLPGDLPPVMDLEVSGGLTPAQVVAALQAWITHIEQKLGVVPFIYSGLFSWPDLTNSADMTTSPLWVAQYTSAACPDIPAPWTRWMFWQYTSSGSVSGIPGATLDLDTFNGTLDDLRAVTVAGTCGDGVCSGGETAASCPADCQPCGIIPAMGGIIDDGDACFVTGGPPQYLRQVTGAGEGGDLIWTHATPAASESNYAQWNLDFASAGIYRVEAYTDHAYATSTRAAYVINGQTTVRIDQSAVDGWQSLGQFPFVAGGGQSVHLGDNTGEPTANNAQLVFDAIRLTRVGLDEPPVTGNPGGGEPGDIHAGCATTRGTSWPIALVVVLVVRRRRRRAAIREGRAVQQ